MFRVLAYLIFIISVALAAGGILLSSRLRNRYNREIFSLLLYYQVFIFTFGFYGIWGQVVIRAFLTPYISEELLVRFTDISMLLGLPFLVFAWMMLLRFSAAISGRKMNNWYVFGFLLINFTIIVIVGFIMSGTNVLRPAALIKYYFILMHFIYSVWSSVLIIFMLKGRSIIHDYDRMRIGPGIFLVMVIQCLPLLFYESQPNLSIIFTFTFFAGNTFLPVYMSYGTLLTVFTSETGINISFEEFCKKFEVSPRETDIVREICNGLSNKEISEKLFISLQTVKDHTHRIYIKTNVKSRVQLIYLVKELKILS
ncbi:MAG: LuxR C-terminal-related transcriptional regulator [Bacteroidales bacterium]